MVYRPPNCTRSRYKFHVFKHNVRFLLLFFHPLSHCLSRLLDLSIYFMSPSIFFLSFWHLDVDGTTITTITSNSHCSNGQYFVIWFALSISTLVWTHINSALDRVGVNAVCIWNGFIMYGLNVIALLFFSYSFAFRSCSVGIFIVLKAMHCSNSYGEFLQCLRFTTMAKLK